MGKKLVDWSIVLSSAQTSLEIDHFTASVGREYLQYQHQRWETEQLLAASNQPLPAFTPSPRVLDQEIIPSPSTHLSFPGAPLLQQLAQSSPTMSAATGELPLIPSASSYDYSKLWFAYLTMLGLTEQVIPT
ncbi:hypothetical protein DSO57_1018675 [Entomophthora muscae]|uniref:Uncharacterized protein n=1 Tax=Entomophthora muscae TaxID=34485 RepID=A0ACC2U226_9FUNG|nr:hypothetical protein DSO57_1018675 [Entomophthora muscae]